MHRARYIFPVILRIIFQTFLQGVLTLTEDTYLFQESRFFCLNNFLVRAWIKGAHMEGIMCRSLIINGVQSC